ncbi:MAG: GNAT family N-acetyltransferase [Candidatus Paceibacterota bacterium]
MKENPLAKYNTLGLRGPVHPMEREKLSIYFAGPEDLEEFKKMKLESFSNDPGAFSIYSPEKLEKKVKDVQNYSQENVLSPVRFTVMSRYDSKPMGIVGAVKEDDGTWIIHSVYINPSFRKGLTEISVAKEMIQKALSEIKQRGGTKVILWVENTREHAIALYKSLGFKKSKQPKEIFYRVLKKGHGLMELDLNAG